MRLSYCFIAFLSAVGSIACTSAFSPGSLHSIKGNLAGNQQNYLSTSSPVIAKKHASLKKISTALQLSRDKNYSTEVRLREEAEAPFRKVRFFVYSALLGGCFISLIVSAARIAAGLNGINADLLGESTTNAAIDLGGIALLSFLLKTDADAQESRLKRASKGGELAALPVRGKAPFFIDQESKTYTTLTLSSFRAGRGIDKRVVICAAGEERISAVVNDMNEESFQESLILNDLLIVPVICPEGTAPIAIDDVLLEKECIAFPYGRGWKEFIASEVEDASKQGVDVDAEGFALILKKNGRVGQNIALLPVSSLSYQIPSFVCQPTCYYG